jgi:hypothetical protein
MEDARRTVNNQYAHLPVRRFVHSEHFRASRLGAGRTLAHLVVVVKYRLVSTRVIYRQQLKDQQLELEFRH